MKKIFTIISVVFLFLSSYSQKQSSTLNLNNQQNITEVGLLEKTSDQFFLQAKRVSLLTFNNSVAHVKRKDTLNLNLFHDKTYKAVVLNNKTNVNGTVSIVSKLIDFSYAYGFISIDDGKALVSIDIPELSQKYVSRTDAHNQYIFLLDNKNLDILEGAPSLIPPDTDTQKIYDTPTAPPEKMGKNNQLAPQKHLDTTTQAMHSKLGVSDTAQIDIMVVYTPAAQAWANANEGNINNTIADFMAKCNLVSDNSNLLIDFNLVHSALVSYVEENPVTDLTRLTTPSDGYMDVVHALRDQYAADLVVLFSLETQVGGLAWQLNNRHGRPTHGFSITRVQQASSSYTGIHEIGHNMGAHHHKQQNYQPGPTNWSNWSQNNWSAGWRWTGSDNNHYCSVMTYESGTFFSDSITHTRVPYFSDPNINYMGVPTGHSVNGDNARTIRKTKHYVAQYRDANTLLYCDAWGDNPYYHISKVEAGSINKSSGGSYYSDFSFYSTDVYLGTPLQVTVDITNPFPGNQLLVWVDWNDDKDFNDPGEEVYVSNVGAASQYVFSITPPIGTTLGPKRMRMRLHINSHGPNSTPCGDSDHGEVEDYTLNLVAGALGVTATAQNSTVCLGAQTQLDANPSGGTGSYTYAWTSDPPGFTSSLRNPTVSPSVTTQYTVVVSEGSQTASSNVTVNVETVPNAPASITGASTVCQNESGVSYSVPPIHSATAYSWTLPQGVSMGSGHNTHTVIVNYGANAESGNISVVASNSCGSSPSSPLFPVTVDPLPDAAGAITGPSNVYSGQTGVNYSVPTINNATDYIWTVPQGLSIVNGHNTNSITINVVGTTQGDIYVYGSNNCGDGTVSPSHNVSILANIEDVQVSSFYAYPNPSDGLFIIDIDKNYNELLQLDIYTIFGELVLSKPLERKSRQYINARHLANGLYLLNISGNSSIKNKMLIIQK